MSGIRSVLFICTGNSCRSVMAEGLIRKKLRELGKDGIKVYSAGTRAFDGFPPTDETVRVMEEEGVDVSEHRSMSVTREMIQAADLVLVMEPGHKEEVVRIDPKAIAKTFLMKEYGRSSEIDPGGFVIRDPIGMPIEEYLDCRNAIKKEIERISEKL